MSFMSGLRRFRFRSFRSLRSSRSRGLVCQEVVELVTDYLEGALSPAEHRRFEEHLAGCPHCTEYLAQMRETIRLAGRLADCSVVQTEFRHRLAGVELEILYDPVALFRRRIVGRECDAGDDCENHGQRRACQFHG